MRQAFPQGAAALLEQTITIRGQHVISLPAHEPYPIEERGL